MIDASRNNDAASTAKTYVKRPGTAAVGQYYETKILTMVLFRLLHDAQVEEFYLGNNLDEAGAFDDVVLRATIGGKLRVYCIQAKHRKFKSAVNFEDLIQAKKPGGDFHLKKYFESFLKIRYMFSSANGHAIFHGEFEETELELIIFTPALLNYPDKINCENTCETFTTKDSKTIFEIKCTPGILNIFTEFSKEWHKKTVSEILTKMILSLDYDTTNLNETMEKLKSDNILKKFGTREDSFNYSSILQLYSNQKVMSDSNKNINPLLKTVAEILDESLLPPHEFHVKLVNDFFKKLRFYTEQATEDELGEIIKRDIKQNSYEFEDLIYLKSHQAVESWWKRMGDVSFQTKTCNIFKVADTEAKLEKNQTISLEMVRSDFVVFSNKEAIINPKWVNFIFEIKADKPFFMNISSSTPELSCVKIMQYFRWYGTDFKFVIIDNVEIRHNLKFFSEANPNCLIIVFLPALDCEIIQNIRQNVHKCIVITNEKYISDGKAITDETKSLDDLEEKCQLELLKCEVMFQGSSMPLAAALDGAPNTIIDAITVKTLIYGERLIISNSCFSARKDDSIEWYIDRVLVRHRYKTQVIKSFRDIHDGVVIVAAEPGMGKSTLLTGIARAIKQSNRSTWIVRINLLDYCLKLKQWSDSKTALEKSHAMDFLLEASCYDKNNVKSVENQLFDWNCEQSKIYLLIDGFDEVSPDFSKVVAQLLQLYKQNFTTKLWITTRSGGAQKELEQSLDVRAYSLRSFTMENTKNFLRNFWEARLQIKIEKQALFDEFVKKLLLHLSQSIENGDLDLIGVPLQIKMIALIFQDNFNEYYNLKTMELNFEKLDIVTLYERFIEMKFKDILIKEKNKLDICNPFVNSQIKPMFEQFQNNHKQAAIYSLFNQEDVKGLFSESEEQNIKAFIKKIEDSTEKTGIITRVVDGKPIFVHQTYAEFFAAVFIWEKYCSLQNNELEKFINEIIINNLIGGERVQIAKFLQLKVKNEMNNYSNGALQARVLLDKLLDNAPNTWKTFNKKCYSYLLAIVEHSLSSDGECFKDYKNLINSKNDYIQDILRLTASECGYIHLVSMVNDERIDATFDWLEDRTALHLATSENRSDIVEHLVKNSANINKVTKENGQSALHIAAENGNKNLVQLLLEKGADANLSLTHTGLTALHLAAREGFVDIVVLLVTHNVVIDSATTADGETPLYIAAGNGHLEIVENLIKAGADVNFGTRKNGSTPLHIATKNGHLAVVRALLEKKCLIDVGTTDFGFTPLHWAVRENLFDIASLLLDKGASTKSATKVVCLTPLHFAAARGHAELVNLLLDKEADISVATAEEGWTPLHLAARKNMSEIVSVLLARGADIDSVAVADEGGTPLQSAAEMGHFETAQLLISKGANVNYATKRVGWTALHWAAQNNFREIVSLLLESGANIDRGTFKDGKTAFDIAIENDNPDIVEILLGKGASARAKGSELLHDAVKIGSYEVVKWLVNKGIDVNCRRGQFESTPLLEACTRGHLNVVKLLLDAGAGVNFGISNIWYTPMHEAARRNSPDIINVLAKHGANINCMTTDGRTPLYEAVFHLAVDAVKMLLSLGANANVYEMKEGHTPLHRAAMQKHDNSAAKKDALEIVRVLLDHGASYLPIGSGLNPLHAVATGGSPEILELILGKGIGIDINSQCRAIWKDVAVTPLFQACASGNLEIARILINKGANVHLGTSNIAYMPLHWAAHKNCPEIIDILVANGANINCRTSDDGRTALYEACNHNAKDAVEILLKLGADAELAETDNGLTPLLTAAVKRYVEVVRVLLKHGVSVQPTATGLTALHAAAQCGSRTMLKLLLNKNIDINGRYGEDRVTPLYLACGNGHSDMVPLLLDKGADVNLGTSNGYRPIHWAARYNDTKIIKLLVAKGADINCTTTDTCRTPLNEATRHNASNAMKLLQDMATKCNAENIYKKPKQKESSGNENDNRNKFHDFF